MKLKAAILLAGFAFGFSYLKYFFHGRDIYESIFIVAYCGIIFAVINILLLRKAIKAKREGGKLYAISGVTAVIVVIVTGLLLPTPLPIKDVTVNVTALGGQNAFSKGTEVWLKQIMVDGAVVDFNSMALEEGWELRHEVPVSYDSQPAVLTWTGSVSREIVLTFTEHPYSGTVLVESGNFKQELDLFNEQEKFVNIQIPVNEGVSVYDYAAWFGMLLGISITSFSLSCFLCIFFNRYLKVKSL